MVDSIFGKQEAILSDRIPSPPSTPPAVAQASTGREYITTNSHMNGHTIRSANSHLSGTLLMRDVIDSVPRISASLRNC